MNDSERIGRKARASQLKDEILAPILIDMRKSYSERIVEVASKELDPVKRERSITSLSVAVRILDNIETGINALIEDGRIAESNVLKSERVEKMSKPARRLLGIAPY